MLTGLTAHSHLLLLNSVSSAALLNSLDLGALLAPWCFTSRRKTPPGVPLRVLTGPQQLSLRTFQ